MPAPAAPTRSRPAGRPGAAAGAARPRPRRAGAFFRRFVLYLAAAWGVLLALAAGHPAAFAAVLAAALYTTVPLAAFARGGGAWRRYPSAAFRLFVVRPALYAQLLLPVAAAAALLGLASGAPFGRALAAGRAAALAAAAAAALFFAAGWAGSRRLRVREVEARVPGCRLRFDGLRVAQLSDLHVGRRLAPLPRPVGAGDRGARARPRRAHRRPGRRPREDAAGVRPLAGRARGGGAAPARHGGGRRQPRHLRRVAGGGRPPSAPTPGRGCSSTTPCSSAATAPRSPSSGRATPRRRVGGGPRRRAGVRPRAGGRAGARARAQPAGWPSVARAAGAAPRSP
jgi:hypothetical protein